MNCEIMVGDRSCGFSDFSYGQVKKQRVTLVDMDSGKRELFYIRDHVFDLSTGRIIRLYLDDIMHADAIEIPDKW